MGYKQGLDNGVMGKSKTPGGPDNIQGSTKKNFFNAIAPGENPNGQTTISPGMVTNAGVTQYDQQNHPMNIFGGDRWAPKKY